jgi:hypothetical protein
MGVLGSLYSVVTDADIDWMARRHPATAKDGEIYRGGQTDR